MTHARRTPPRVAPARVLQAAVLRSLPALAALAAGLLPAGPAAAQSLAAAAPTSGADANSPFAPAAFVNNRVVTRYDLDQRIKLLAMVGAPNSAQQAMDSLIDEKLKRSAAADAGVAVERPEVDQGLARFAASNGLDAEALAARLKAAGVSRVALRDYIESEILWTNYVRARFLSRSQVTDLELDDELKNGDRLSRTLYDLTEIVIPFGANRDAAMARASDIAAQINGGADAAALARRFSAAPTAAQGGRVGMLPPERLPPQLRTALDGMSAGQATQPVSVPGAAAVLVLNERKVERAEPTPELREQIRGQMLEERLTRLADARLAELRAAAFIDQRR